MSKIEFNLLESRNGFPIIEANVEGKPFLLHSKYDPIKEAERFIDSWHEKIEAADYILFYGAGMGYHIKAFFERYPEKIASVYEPFEEISYLTVQNKSVTKFPFSLLEHYVVQTEKQVTLQTLSVFNTDLNHKFEMIVLPSYGKLQDDRLKKFIDIFKKLVDTKKGNIASAFAYSRRWTINALMNLPKTLEHPNFLVEKKQYFKGKPAIIVSAGPSLSEEIENLRKIKIEGSAYIFAVGSAYKALIKEDIYPDAICTYDPQNHNYTIFNELVENKIDTIPMIYGTTVGFETVDYYKGPKLYFPVSQDKLTVHFHNDPQVIVYDATTIAIVTLQLLNLLEVSKVILVGQNLALKKDKYYAEGIKRYDEKKKEASDNTANEKDLEQTFEVEDVHGGMVLTNDEFRRMKNDMENYLSLMEIPVINTTNGGAAIKGTIFKPLNELMKEELNAKVVVEDWWKNESKNSSDVLNKSFLRKYRKAFESFEQQDNELQKFLTEFNQALPTLEDNQIQRKLEKFDELFQKFHSNEFYLTTIFPIVQLAFEKLKSENQLIVAMANLKKKVQKISEVYTSYLQQCRQKYLDVAPIVSNYTLLELCKEKNYVATSGVFHYEGEWNKRFPPEKETMPEDLTEEEQEAWQKQKKLEDKIDFPIPLFVDTKQKGAKLQFRFKGTRLSLFGLNLTNQILKLNIQIDNKNRIITIGENELETTEGYIRKGIFSVVNLKNTIHHVTIEVLSDNPNFLFEGIEIDDSSSSRAYHIHEVERVEELEVGKRIRCHYRAPYNTVGEFIGLGDEKASFLPVEACAEPEGDFYFIMVDEIDGEKKLIADRNVQNEISWLNIAKRINNCHLEDCLMTLPSGGINADDRKNDWFKFIESNAKIDWNLIDGLTSWCIDRVENKKESVAIRGRYYGAGQWWGNSGHYWHVSGNLSNHWPSNGFRPIFILNKKKG
ncbi:hypothetical protein SAMN05880501_101267 [Ureibacillus xyleni]|uniref:6-hydroxymethylpterin diphosphokinase MptE-like domain-containing protein n=1 Tax=Ureibacillus xyleni TaxID=614648 RepID=A0A285RAJ4_9BACL|nr:6-hydroxymethylpterin diphosphokinase MptE-like protein [Ureibacillus xyleni]SOB91133.1 hypothetical protein SAMN05880501_101267 [Ureibacillus xyleni]